MKENKTRTLSQNNAMHVYFKEVSDELNNAGISVPLLLKNFELDMTPYIIKECWKQAMKIKLGKDSTTKLNTQEISIVYEEFSRRLSVEGLYIPFPSIEAQKRNEHYANYLG